MLRGVEIGDFDREDIMTVFGDFMASEAGKKDELIIQLRADITRLTERIEEYREKLEGLYGERHRLKAIVEVREGERDALLPLIKDLSEESDASINDSAIGWNYRRHARRIMGERAAALRGDDNA